MALLGAALAQLVASKFSGQWKNCDKCSRRPRPGLRHEMGYEIVDPTKRRRQDFEGQSHETKDKGNEHRLRSKSRKADSAFHLEAQGRVRAALRGPGKGLLQGRRARRAAR